MERALIGGPDVIVGFLLRVLRERRTQMDAGGYCPVCGGKEYNMWFDAPPDYYLPRCVECEVVMIPARVQQGGNIYSFSEKRGASSNG